MPIKLTSSVQKVTAQSDVDTTVVDQAIQNRSGMPGSSELSQSRLYKGGLRAAFLLPEIRPATFTQGMFVMLIIHDVMDSTILSLIV
ncbi:Probable L,D-transpeptidase YbiS precursor [Cedecea neteri]|uniref:Probable L,D-transpeptidase YbiS n=1 Tax=Cedecea neteri TaxID=158822 RepID=A0A2X3KXT6_9ENTR|nr:Probable L,D-transpeptidase YbiS precursor [Cedecea neteri]